MRHPDFAVLTVSWELALRADGYADNTVKAYQNAVRSLAGWLAEHHPDVGPAQLERQHIRGWLVEVRERHSSNTARGWFAGVRHFCRWLQSEGEADRDATAGIRTPAPGDPKTPILSDADLRALLATCAGTDFTARRDTAIIMLFLDGGLRLSELAGLQVADVDLRDRIVYVAGKASRRSGPRHGAVPLGVKAARALDRATCASGGGIRTRTRRGYGWVAEVARPLKLMGLMRCSSAAAPRPASGICTRMHSATPGRTPSERLAGTRAT
jgi:integrase/recombinase XerC